jgi:hypothetical protein
MTEMTITKVELNSHSTKHFDGFIWISGYTDLDIFVDSLTTSDGVGFMLKFDYDLKFLWLSVFSTEQASTKNILYFNEQTDYLVMAATADAGTSLIAAKAVTMSFRLDKDTGDLWT